MRNSDIKDKIKKINEHISDLEIISKKKEKIMTIQHWMVNHRIKEITKFSFRNKVFEFTPSCNLIFEMGYIRQFTGIKLFLLNDEVTIQQHFQTVKVHSGHRNADRWNEDIIIIKGIFSKTVIIGYRLS
jgi:hypothetical protein